MTWNPRWRKRRPRYKAAVHVPDFDTLVTICHHISKGKNPRTTALVRERKCRNSKRECQLWSGDVGYVTWRSLSNIYRDPPSYQISIIPSIFSFSMLFLFLYLQERSRSYFPARRWSPYRTAPWQNNQRGPVALQQFFLWKSLKLSFRLHKKFPWFIDLEMITFIYI